MSSDGATSTDGFDLWAAGAVDGVRYTPLGSTGATTLVSNTVMNLRQLNIQNGQLYVSTASAGMQS